LPHAFLKDDPRQPHRLCLDLPRFAGVTDRLLGPPLLVDKVTCEGLSDNKIRQRWCSKSQSVLYKREWNSAS